MEEFYGSYSSFSLAIRHHHHLSLLFCSLTLGLSIFVALIETKYVLSKDETYKRMVRFWGSIFVINFAAGVVTGIVQEFHFGLNWSEYSRFVGEIFGAPLQWKPFWHSSWSPPSSACGSSVGISSQKKFHLIAAWLVAIATNVSGYPSWLPLVHAKSSRLCHRARAGGGDDLGRCSPTPTCSTSTARSGSRDLHRRLPGAWFQRLPPGEKKGDMEPFRISFRWAAIYSLIVCCWW